MAESFQKDLARVVAKAWADPDFKKWLKTDAKGALAELGIAAPQGVEIELVENTARKIYFVLPKAPSMDRLSDEEIETITIRSAHPYIFNHTSSGMPCKCNTCSGCPPHTYTRCAD